MALRALIKADVKKIPEKISVVHLYRSIIREVPRVLTIYDIDMPLKTARNAIAYHFRKHDFLKDGRVIGLLISKGYMELEETLMQWKQKTHLLRVLEPMELQKSTTDMTNPDVLVRGPHFTSFCFIDNTRYQGLLTFWQLES
eukprot:gene4752-9437_t